MRRTSLTLLLLAVATGLTPAAELSGDFCRALIAEETRERELIVRDIEEAGSHREATERIYVLVQTLWERDAIEKLRYLGFKHERDVSNLNEKLHRIRLMRQEATLAQYAALCDTQSDTADAAFESYTEALCTEYSVELKIAETNRDYDIAVLESFRDLRKNNAATEVDIIVSERSLAMSEKRAEWARQRVAACDTDSKASGPGD